MSRSVYRRETCRLCGKRNLELVIKLVPTPIADAYIPADRLDEVQEIYPLDTFFCHDCGHVQLLDVVDPKLLYGNYIYVTASSPGLVEHFQKYANSVLKYVKPAEGSLVVDIGSNDGTLLSFFQNAGMRVLGVDPGRDIAQKATESGIETWPTFFTKELAQKIKRERGPATIITANNVVANIDDLVSLFEGVCELLAPDGVFIFETGYLVDLVQKIVFDNIYHEHLSYHSVKPFEAFFRDQGLELIKVERVPTKGGSLRGVTQLVAGPRPVTPSVAELIALETRLGFDRAETYKAMATKLDNIKNQLGNLLDDLEAQSKTVAGYGASHSVTTLIYHFNLGNRLNFIVDDNPRKQALFSPGYYIPVLSPQVIYEQKPDYVVILPWRFAEQIMAKHQAYLDQGGHFILLLPEIEIK